jgi:hypothetical protein
MPDVNANDAAEMQRFIDMMEGRNPGPTPLQRGGNMQQHAPLPVDDGGASAMKDILLAMYEAAPELQTAGRHLNGGGDDFDPVGAAYQQQQMEAGGGYIPEMDEYGNENPAYTRQQAVHAARAAQSYAPPAFDPAGLMVERAKGDRELREAMMTSVNDDGVRIGKYQIVVNENDAGLKSFDITNAKTAEAIATDLTLYEAARGIVRHLNEGLMINSREIREILNTEAIYGRSRQNAAEARERQRVYERRNDPSKANLMEARYSDSLAKAKAAKARLIDLTK